MPPDVRFPGWTRLFRICLVFWLSGWSGGTLDACLWDYDTLQMERRRFPGIHELITGRFVRHGREYYEWRVADRRRRLEAAPDDPALVDDLAVALDKLGRPLEGIEELKRIRKLHGDRYETIANLGTLLIHAGQHSEGARWIERALEINPEAHFGRERFQLLLVQYIQKSELKTEGVLSTESRFTRTQKVGFAQFVTGDRWDTNELNAALKGVMGIVHFGNAESPVVLEALGDLLLRTGEGRDDARLLAARAYLKAARNSTRADVADRYRNMAEESLMPNADYHGPNWTKAVALVADSLEVDLREASNWRASIEADERAWIQQGADVDRRFSEKYYESLPELLAAAETQLQKEPVHERTYQSYRWDQIVTLFRWALIFGMSLLSLGIIFQRVRDER
ncbi:MAG: hypothetical protein J0M24_08560 [Verrucomicrobia bacterium]|nr:hypothetical protein [Verrucomicrobiota bacterium]